MIQFQLADQIMLLSLIGLIVVNAYLLALVFFNATKQKPTYWFIIFIFTSTFQSVSHYFSFIIANDSQLFLIRLSMLASILQVFTFYKFIQTFTNNSNITLPRRVIEYIATVTVAIICITSGIFASLEFRDNMPVPQPGALAPLFGIYVVIFLVPAFLYLYKTYKDKNNATLLRQQSLRLLIANVIMYTILFVFEYIATVVFKNTSFVQLNSLTGLFGSALTIYVVSRYQLLSVKLRLKRTFIIAIFTALISVFATTVTYFIFISGLSQLIVFILIAVVITTTLWLALYLIQSILARSQYALYTPDQMLIRNDSARDLRTWEYDIIQSLHRKLGYKEYVIFIYDWEEKLYRSLNHASKDIIREEHSLIAWCNTQPKSFTLQDLDRDNMVLPMAARNEIANTMKKYHATAAIPLRSFMFVHGVVLVGNSQKMIVPDDLDNFGYEFGNTLKNIQSYEAFMRQYGKPEDKPKQVLN